MDHAGFRNAVLPDGRAVVIRPITRDDKGALADAFTRLGPGSRYRRFLTPQKSLSTRDLRYLTEIDHHDHEALIAIDPATEKLIAVARYVRQPDDRAAAELAVTVVDDWQECGVGTVLAKDLADCAHAEGIQRFTALVLAENARMLNLLEELGAPEIVDRGAGQVELVVDLPVASMASRAEADPS